MPSADDYAKRVVKIVRAKGDLKKGVQRRWKWETVPEAKQHLASIRQMQKELRQVKREINVEMKAIRAAYKARSARVKAGFWVTLAGRGAARRDEADKKRKLREERDRVLAPYEAVKLTIDDALTKLDEVKLQLQSWIDQHQ